MRRVCSLLIATGLLAFAGCSSDDGDDGDADRTTAVGEPNGSSATGSAAPVDSADSADEPASAPGDVDCAAIEAALGAFGVPVQLMAQVRSPEVLQSIEDGVMAPLDIDAFLAAVDELRVLEAYPSSLGDPGESLDLYERAGRALKTLFEAAEVTQSDIDAYNAEIGPIPEFIGKQVAISGSVDAAGC